jgi:hypothetical protein
MKPILSVPTPIAQLARFPNTKRSGKNVLSVCYETINLGSGSRLS